MLIKSKLTMVSLDLMSVAVLSDPSVSTHLGQPASQDGLQKGQRGLHTSFLPIFPPADSQDEIIERDLAEVRI